jgi:hypothetical protein
MHFFCEILDHLNALTRSSAWCRPSTICLPFHLLTKKHFGILATLRCFFAIQRLTATATASETKKSPCKRHFASASEMPRSPPAVPALRHAEPLSLSESKTNLGLSTDCPQVAQLCQAVPRAWNSAQVQSRWCSSISSFHFERRGICA